MDHPLDPARLAVEAAAPDLDRNTAAQDAAIALAWPEPEDGGHHLARVLRRERRREAYQPRPYARLP
ncbi:MAG: hypothetical protein RQ833_00580 [Sphingomonadaceae bacterium]|nr:hypothetical protein [Sphingomonadaceae bacterium]